MQKRAVMLYSPADGKITGTNKMLLCDTGVTKSAMAKEKEGIFKIYFEIQ